MPGDDIVGRISEPLFNLLDDMIVHVTELVKCTTNFGVHGVYNLAKNSLENVYKLLVVYLKIMRLRLILVHYQQVWLALVYKVTHRIVTIAIILSIIL